MKAINVIRCILLCQIICLIACQTKTKQYDKIKGKTMGTYYQITLEDDDDNHKNAIDSILIKLNKELSTYDEESLISAFNRSTDGITLKDTQLDLKSFKTNLDLAKEINQLSNGAFDPSLMPLINYWGFGYNGREAINQIDSSKIEYLLSQTGLQQVTLDLDTKRVNKVKEDLELDFSAIAKGYGVDLVAHYLDRKQVANYLVDIGGESRAKGVNSRAKSWTLGINTPLREAGLAESMEYVQLTNVSMATSGNYRNYLETNSGQTYGHTIDPKTGYPAETDMLSASVIADECMKADAWATTFMAIGVKKSKQLIEELDGIEALFIFGTHNSELDIWQSSGFGQFIFDQ